MLKGILAVEEEHADELSDLLQGLPAHMAASQASANAPMNNPG
jgi:bacterioferritin (cytochrome b1)